MAKDTETDSAGGTLRKLALPTALGVAGSAIAVVLTKKPKQLDDLMPKVREALPDLPQGGVGELTDDLKGRLDSVLGRDEGDGDEVEGFDEQAPSRIDAEKFEQRREDRRKRREQRRRRAA
jgi:hypothetical protein